MKSYVILFAFVAFLTSTASNKVFSQQTINWISVQEAEAAIKKAPKRVLIDLYTDWCGWCRVMDNRTFSHPWIIKYINENFYAIKFNAETKDTIVFNGKEYINTTPPTARRGAHQLTHLWLNRIGYPSFAFLDEDLSLITSVAGFHTASKFEPILTYIATKADKTQTFDSFSKSFVGQISEEE